MKDTDGTAAPTLRAAREFGPPAPTIGFWYGEVYLGEVRGHPRDIDAARSKVRRHIEMLHPGDNSRLAMLANAGHRIYFAGNEYRPSADAPPVMMGAEYRLIMLLPHMDRADSLCIGLVAKDARGRMKVHIPDDNPKLAGFRSVDRRRLQRLAEALQRLVESDNDFTVLAHAMDGAVSLHQFSGAFAYSSQAEFDVQVSHLLREMVLPPEAELPEEDELQDELPAVLYWRRG